ncbi:MAG: hypothetical protein HETSPECPRED_001169 [Heterodermia speciosa]|uniref:PWI domain-containing protein n=1 Tax=Heterodermia speciosa TaxID=116794 RepID=A0A8H3J122_9LECA|nr:MAG: hypothetical protein HETSPECPRED_001169 [Heterodermia speciosa]
MYNYQGGNTPYGRPPGFGNFPGQNAPPGMSGSPGMAPPGMSAPGVAAPPGMQANNQQPGRSGGFPPNFNPPANMPNINFNAPVIRLGTTGPNKPAIPLGGDSGRRESNVEARSARPGLGAGQSMDAQRQALRESMMQLVPPTKDEISRTIFIGGITEGVGGDDGLERILQCCGNLRRWIRAMDADNKACRFGFAEYEDPESLATAVDVLRDVEVPVKQQNPNDSKNENDGNAKVERSKLLVIVDDASLNYLEQYQASRGDQDPIQAQLRKDAAKSSLANVLAELANPSSVVQQTYLSNLDQDGDSSMQNGEEQHNEEVVTIPLTVDDELSDIPAEMRETVAKEIAAFRDRSTRRDMERLRREEELEAQERRRNMAQPRPSRLASPPLAAPSGPAGGANGIPIGPRDRGVPNAPSGPKSYQGSQIPQDYQKGVTFVNGSGINGAGTAGLINREDEDSDASDEEIERRRKEKRDAEQEKLYQDQKRRWLNRERSRTAAVEREKARDKDDQARQEAHREAMAKQLAEWNDDIEAGRKVQEYYMDRSLWIRNRAAFRGKEANEDTLDRAAEEREKARDMQEREQARGMADDFLNRQAIELDSKSQAPREPQRFKLSLGAAAQKAQAAASNRRTVADVEGLLEDEEEADSSAKRTLIPIKFDSAADALGLTEEERAQAARQLAADIPSDKDGLWKWAVKWEFVDETVLGEQLKPFVEKKIVEYLGVQEQMLVEVVEDHIRKRGSPDTLVEQLEGVSLYDPWESSPVDMCDTGSG